MREEEEEVYNTRDMVDCSALYSPFFINESVVDGSSALCTQSSRFAWMSVLRLLEMLVSALSSSSSSSLPVKWN